MRLDEELNHYGAKKEPILFIIDFEMENWHIYPLDDLPQDIKFSIDKTTTNSHEIVLQKNLVDFETYKKAIDKVKSHIKKGDNYLLNLTFSTPIETPFSLNDIYENANAKFKLLFEDKFVCFSPERFVKIENDKIYTYPMKGTIDASVSNAKEKIINDEKEKAEHIMTVDLLRNDISMVAKNVKVESLRYIDEIKTFDKTLLQVSSKISGDLEDNWQKNLGTILTTLLPAGSITGTPKKKSVEIIKEVELHKRGYFTGIFGVFDGKSLDSAVMIRFIENQNGDLVYKSGGGITYLSDDRMEYEEMSDKIYVPVF